MSILHFPSPPYSDRADAIRPEVTRAEATRAEVTRAEVSRSDATRRRHGEPPERRQSSPSSCVHNMLRLGSITGEWCSETGQILWSDVDGALDPALAVARMFGNFELVGDLPSVRAPGPRVFTYRPSNRLRRSWMRQLPVGVWVEASPGLWMTHDGDLLAMSPDDPLLAARLSPDD